jgi:hypothetical protein
VVLTLTFFYATFNYFIMLDSDLATDCSAIAPDPLPTTHRQPTVTRTSRDNHATPSSSNQRPVLASRDDDERTPLVMSQAVYPQFSRQQKRRATFSNWPLSHVFHPDDLVIQGFYYAGNC